MRRIDIILDEDLSFMQEEILDYLQEHNGEKDLGLVNSEITMQSWYNNEDFEEGFEDLRDRDCIKLEDGIVYLLNDPRKED